MSANVKSDGAVKQLDRKPEPDEEIVESDVTDTGRLVRLLMRILRDIAALKRRWWPRRIDHADRLIDDSTGAVPFRFPHGFGGRVRYWAVGWKPSGLFQGPPQFDEHSSTDANTLVIVSYWTGTMTLRIEEAG